MTQPVAEETLEQEATLVASALALTALYATLRANVVQQLLVLWYSIGQYSAESLAQFLEVALPLVMSAREVSFDATQAYIDMQLEMAGVRAGSPVSMPEIRGGIPLEDVYSRPHKVLWTKLSQGTPFDLARDMGAERLRQLVETDVQLMHTNTSRTLLSDRNDVVGFRRVPTGDYTCALCLIASTQRYRKMDLMPIHPGCDCRVAPIVSAGPVDQVVDPELLESIHAAVENMFGFSDRSGRKVDYRKLLVVREHGEYGPTLAKADNRFTHLNL